MVQSVYRPGGLNHGRSLARSNRLLYRIRSLAALTISGALHYSLCWSILVYVVLRGLINHESDPGYVTEMVSSSRTRTKLTYTSRTGAMKAILQADDMSRRRS